MSVDKRSAEKVLKLAYDNRIVFSDTAASLITSVLKGSHKTYKYVLITALLAKSTNEEVDIFSLQAQDNSSGAYDARSLCHGVIVPFERENFPDGIGGSNEPFLNKPARFPRISNTNAVRSGNDAIALQNLISIFSIIKTKEKAFEYLKHAMSIIVEIYNESLSKFDVDSEILGLRKNIQEIYDYLSDLLDQTNGGEICALIIATVEQLYQGSENTVIAHKVNESGASSKEVGDIDVYDSCGQLILSIEAKDKVFALQDVGHALRKFYEGGVERSMFIYGKTINVQRTCELQQLLARYGRIGCYCAVLNIMDYISVRLLSMGDVTLADCVSMLMKQAKEMKVSDKTIEWVKEKIPE